MAAAGFCEDEIHVTSQKNNLFISDNQTEDDHVNYLHRGIAGRACERRFELAEHITVTEANLANGLLQVELFREIPDEKMARSIDINTKAVEHKKAA